MKPKFLCLLLCLGSIPPAAALGLGDLEVRSALGQPLHATIRIIEPGAAVTADCFTLQPAADAVVPLPNTQFDLERRGSQVLLHIRTPRAIVDPIVQFALTSECETRLRRDYVLLLDPPVTAQAPVLGDTPPAAATIAAAPPPSARPVKRTRLAPAAASGRATAAPGARAAAAPAPRLVLSGRRLASVGEGGVALRLDTALPDLNRPRSEPLTATELSDENTALTRKLAHLESQLAALQQRNAELEAHKGAQAATPVPVTPAPATGRPQWPLYLLLAGLLGGAGGLIAWMRRRRRPALNLPDDEWHAHPPIPPRRSVPAPDEWADAAEAPRSDAVATAPTTPPVGSSPSRPESTRRIEPAFDLRTADDNTEVKDDILDQAEVFMAHGHGELAVHLLQEHLREAPDESPVPWLLLLDLLHRAGDSAGYAATAAQCRRHYNIDLSRPPVSQDADAEDGPGLEAYPHVTERLVHVWHSPEVNDFFRELIYDNRGGTRVGFEPGAYRDILLLRAIAEEGLAHAA